MTRPPTQQMEEGIPIAQFHFLAPSSESFSTDRLPTAPSSESLVPFFFLFFPSRLFFPVLF